MDWQTEFRLLGTLDVLVGGVPQSLGGPRQQIVLANLLLAHPNPVSSDRLIDAVWGDSAPPTAATTLQAYVSRLRKVLGAAGSQLRSDSRGYRLDVEPSAIDVHRFETAVDEALLRSQASEPSDVVTVLEPALALWRSAHALEEMQGEPWVADFSTRLTERRLAAIELLTSAQLDLGEHLAALVRLEDALAEWPLRESLVYRLMLGLYRAGRQVDALAAYDKCRAELRKELGLEPSAELRKLQRDILNHSERLVWRPPASLAPTRMLPPRNPLLTGRDSLVDQVRGLLAEHGVVTVHGLGGVGKTAIAVEIGHLHRGPAAWVPAENRPSLVAGLAQLARRLKVRIGADDADVLASLWTTLDERNDWLLVYDNAEELELVRELLPASSSVKVLITSQNTAWSALGPTVRVDPFAPEDAARFVLRRSGRRDSSAAITLAELLGHLPLALEQASAYVDETGLSLAEYLRLFHLRQDQLLMRGAPAGHRDTVTTTWQIVFDRVRARSPLAARILEVAAFVSPDSIPLDLLVPVLDDEVSELKFADAVAELLRFSLVDRDDGTLRVHRLVQSVVRTQLAPQERIRRATDAIELLRRAAPDEPTVPEAWESWAAIAPHVAALLRASSELSQPPSGMVPLALDAFRYLRGRSALAAAHALLDSLIEIVQAPSASRSLLGELYAERGDLLDAEGHLGAAREELERSLAMFESEVAPDDLQLARIRARLAHVLNCADEPQHAAKWYSRCLPVLRGQGGTSEVVRALIGLGYTYWSLDQFELGAAQFREALDVLDRVAWRDHPLVAEAHSGLGMMLHEQGRPAEARDRQMFALTVLERLYRDVDHPTVAEVHDKLGWSLRLLGETDGARREHARAADMLRALFGEQDPRYAMALTNLGLAELEAGCITEATARQRQAHAILLRAYGPAHRNTRLVADRLDAIARLTA